MSRRAVRNRQGVSRVVVGTILLALAAIGSYTFIEEGRPPAGSRAAEPTVDPSVGEDDGEPGLAQTADTYLDELDRLGPCSSSDLGAWTSQTLGVSGETVFVLLPQVAETLPVVRGRSAGSDVQRRGDRGRECPGLGGPGCRRAAVGP